MKTVFFLFAVVTASGLLLHRQLPGWLHLPGTGMGARPSAGEVFYLRSGCRSSNPDGTTVQWSPGQELKTTAQATAAEGSVALTDGTNTMQVPRDAVTQDAGAAEALRRADAASRNAARAMAEQDAARQAHEDYLARVQSEYARRPSVVAPSAVYYPVYVVTGTQTLTQAHHSATDRKRRSSHSKSSADLPKSTPAGNR